jgi:hypothetical protein
MAATTTAHANLPTAMLAMMTMAVVTVVIMAMMTTH